MKLPAIYRKKRGGKYYGNYLASVDGREINLSTKDPDDAREVLQAYLRESAAAASEPDVEDASAGEAARAGETAAAPVPAQASPAPGPIVPELVSQGTGVNPPPPSSAADARAEADATNQAAAETGGAAANDNAGAEAFTLPPGAIDGLLAQGAQALVILQLELQAWIIRKRTGKLPPQIDPSAPAAKMLIDAAAQGWVAQFKRWFPDIETCPPWMIAVGAPLLFFPLQMAAAKDAPAAQTPENKAAEPAQAAA